MPHLRLRSLSSDQVKDLSQPLCQELAKILATPEDNFSFELIATQFYSQGKPVEADPMVEVLWFDRGQDVQDKAASKITELVKTVSSALYIAVVFIPLAPSAYYENGQHF